MKKEEKVAAVKDLLNQVLILCGKSKDEFLEEVAQTVQDLLQEKDETKEDEIHDSNCEWYDSSANC